MYISHSYIHFSNVGLYILQVIICYYNCSDIVERPREEQEYCYILPFCCKIVHCTMEKEKLV